MANPNFGHWNSTQRYILPATLRHLLIFAHEIPSFSKEMDVSQNGGFSPQIIHFNRFFHYFHHPFWGTRIFGNTQMMFVQPPCFQHRKGHTVLQPSFPLSSLKKGILLRESSDLFPSSPPPKENHVYSTTVKYLYSNFTNCTIYFFNNPSETFLFVVGVESSHNSWRERRRRVGFFCWAGKAFDSCRVVGFFGPFTVRSSKVMTGDGSRNVPFF